MIKQEYVEDRILKISFNDPDSRNAMGLEMAKEFKELWEGLDAKKLDAIVITGEGSAFSAGGNLKMLRAKCDIEYEENIRLMLEFYNSFLGITKLGVPIVAAINGHAIGASLCLACACEVRICSDEAKLGFTFARLGLHPGMGATYFLPRLIGIPKAKELILSGRVFMAKEGEKLGIVETVKKEEVLETAIKRAKEFKEGGLEVLKQIRETFSLMEGSLDKALLREAKCQSDNYASEEFKEKIDALIEKIG